MHTPELIENDDGTFSPKNPASIRFRPSTGKDGYAKIELLLSEDLHVIHEGMYTEESALELLNAQLEAMLPE
ncbi:hypothetical protein GCM10008959_32020 [Deinococcus seoulensis]|uniref:Uncharacterized protein n=2 Tax=Deinococcus seoulensis TaxID=1837379 RepID=A0ABQ2RXZ8_9DEIO|nr:hypothetical protein GCM10008959_32020 [Deinococcus seoulensis]